MFVDVKVTFSLYLIYFSLISRLKIGSVNHYRKKNWDRKKGRNKLLCTYIVSDNRIISDSVNRFIGYILYFIDQRCYPIILPL
jgi:hypothetical protein